MKSTGIVRKVDELGRVVIPKELRRTMGIEEKDPMEIFVDGDKIIFKKYEPRNKCMVTGLVMDKPFYVNGDIVLSEEGANTLVRLLEKELKK